MNELQMWTAVAVIALVTAGIRFLPFAVFRGGKQTPALIEKLGRVLPYAIMGMLVVYCLKGGKLLRCGAVGAFCGCLCGDCDILCMEAEYSAEHSFRDGVLYAFGAACLLTL